MAIATITRVIQLVIPPETAAPDETTLAQNIALMGTVPTTQAIIIHYVNYYLGDGVGAWTYKTAMRADINNSPSVDAAMLANFGTFAAKYPNNSPGTWSYSTSNGQ